MNSSISRKFALIALPVLALGLGITGIDPSRAQATPTAPHKFLVNAKNANSPLFKYTGDVFAAVTLPPNIVTKVGTLQKQLSACLGSSYSPSPPKNLHITLQVIGQVNSLTPVKAIDKSLRSAANKNKAWNLAKHTPNIKLAIHANGLVTLNLPRSDKLTALAGSVRGSLNKGHIAHKPRFDYPNHAHITIGKIINPNMGAAQQVVKQCRSTGTINLKVLRARHFPVRQFSLMKSNHPVPQRDYARLATYFL